MIKISVVNYLKEEQTKLLLNSFFVYKKLSSNS